MNIQCLKHTEHSIIILTLSLMNKTTLIKMSLIKY